MLTYMRVVKVGHGLSMDPEHVQLSSRIARRTQPEDGSENVDISASRTQPNQRLRACSPKQEYSESK
jgi:hypothetical protein